MKGVRKGVRKGARKAKSLGPLTTKNVINKLINENKLIDEYKFININ